MAGVLIAAWLNHRQQVKVETEQLTKELQAYFDAEFDLLREEQMWESEDQESINALEKLDPIRQGAWNLQLASSQKLYDNRAKYQSDLKGLLTTEIKEKRRKALRYFIDHEPDGAKIPVRQTADDGGTVLCSEPVLEGTCGVISKAAAHATRDDCERNIVLPNE